MSTNRINDPNNLEEEEQEKKMMKYASYAVARFTNFTKQITKEVDIPKNLLKELQELRDFLDSKKDENPLNAFEMEARENIYDEVKVDEKTLVVKKYIDEVSKLNTIDDLIAVNKKYDLDVINETMALFSSNYNNKILYDLVLMSEATFNQKKAGLGGNLPEKPILVKMNNGEYKLYGFVNKQWQERDISQGIEGKVPPEWVFDGRKVPVKSADKILDNLMRGHNQLQFEVARKEAAAKKAPSPVEAARRAKKPISREEMKEMEMEIEEANRKNKETDKLKEANRTGVAPTPAAPVAPVSKAPQKSQPPIPTMQKITDQMWAAIKSTRTNPEVLDKFFNSNPHLLNARDKATGNSPLHYLVNNANQTKSQATIALIENLVLKGADPHTSNLEGNTPFDKADHYLKIQIKAQEGFRKERELGQPIPPKATTPPPRPQTAAPQKNTAAAVPKAAPEQQKQQPKESKHEDRGKLHQFYEKINSAHSKTQPTKSMEGDGKMPQGGWAAKVKEKADKFKDNVKEKAAEVKVKAEEVMNRFRR